MTRALPWHGSHDPLSHAEQRSSRKWSTGHLSLHVMTAPWSHCCCQVGQQILIETQLPWTCGGCFSWSQAKYLCLGPFVQRGTFEDDFSPRSTDKFKCHKATLFVELRSVCFTGCHISFSVTHRQTHTMFPQYKLPLNLRCTQIFWFSV